jgi:hypothetical protein
MGAVRCYGSLEDPEVQGALVEAQAKAKEWTVYLVPARGGKRTLAQNKLYRRLLAKLAQQLGRDVAYWHDFLVEKFLGYDDVVTEDGVVLHPLVSTADLSVPEFTDYLNACLSFAADHQVH